MFTCWKQGYLNSSVCFLRILWSPWLIHGTVPFPFITQAIGISFEVLSTLLLTKCRLPAAQAVRSTCRFQQPSAAWVCRDCSLACCSVTQSFGCCSAFIKGKLRSRPARCTLLHLKCVGYSWDLRELRERCWMVFARLCKQQCVFFNLFLPRCQTINTVLSTARVQCQNKSWLFILQLSRINVDVSFGAYSERNLQITESTQGLCFKRGG